MELMEREASRTDPMQGSIHCPSCSRGIQVEAGGRLPPWCRACGVSLSDALSAAAPVGETVPQPPAYFHACVPQVLQHERLTSYRFYAVGGELLVFPAGLGSIQSGQFVPQTRANQVKGLIAPGAGLAGAWQRWADLQAAQAAEQLAELEGSTESVIVQGAREIKGAVAIPAGELSRVRIEAAGTWFSLTRGFRCAAILKLGYARFGTLALPSLTDTRQAVEGLTKLLGSALEVDLPRGQGNLTGVV
jgi:hypothetical protein